MSMMTLYDYEPVDNIIDSCLHGAVKRHAWLKLEAKRLRKLGRTVKLKKYAGMSKLRINRLVADGQDW